MYQSAAKILNKDALVDTAHNKDPIVLVQQFFVHSDPKRHAETTYCLKRNLENKYIDQIILLNERLYTNDEMGISDTTDKIKQVVITDRLTYAKAFEYAISNLKNRYVILSNSDIFLGDDIVNLRRSCLSKTPSAYTLLRYEFLTPGQDLSECKLFTFTNGMPRWDSQDTWIFHTSSLQKTNELVEHSNFCLGKPGCDNRITFVLQTLGNVCYNAVSNIRTYHYHTTQIRNYGRKDLVPGPYLMVLPDIYTIRK
jgi:hypothetical protein